GPAAVLFAVGAVLLVRRRPARRRLVWTALAVQLAAAALPFGWLLLQAGAGIGGHSRVGGGMVPGPPGLGAAARAGRRGRAGRGGRRGTAAAEGRGAGRGRRAPGRRARGAGHGSRSIGQVMQCGPPRPRPSSPPLMVSTSTPLARRWALLVMFRS